MHTPLDIIQDFVDQDIILTGEYLPDPHDTQTQIMNAKLCSYLIGMIVPGRRSLFMEAVLQAKQPLFAAQKLSYQISRKFYDRNMGLLKILVEVYADGQLLAVDQLTAYVRAAFSAANALPEYAPDNDAAGKTVLVIGGTKGIGAELVKKYAVQGARVIATYYHDGAEAEKLRQLLTSAPHPPEIVQCDVSSESACVELLRHLEADGVSIDTMYLCAALAPHNLELYNETYAFFEAYVNQSMRLFYHPFFTFLKRMAPGGTVNVFSSVAMLDKKTNWPMTEYICAKSILESVVERTVYSAQRPDLRFRIIRAPKMLTEMNNTPIGRLEAMEPKAVAEKIYRESELAESSSLYLNF